MWGWSSIEVPIKHLIAIDTNSDVHIFIFMSNMRVKIFLTFYRTSRINNIYVFFSLILWIELHTMSNLASCLHCQLNFPIVHSKIFYQQLSAFTSLHTKTGDLGSDGPGIDFFRGTPDRTMCPEVDSASESKYQGFLLG